MNQNFRSPRLLGPETLLRCSIHFYYFIVSLSYAHSCVSIKFCGTKLKTNVIETLQVIFDSHEQDNPKQTGPNCPLWCLDPAVSSPLLGNKNSTNI